MAARVLVVGFGLNNRPLVPFLVREGAEVVVADRRRLDPAEQAGVPALHWCLGPDYLIEARRWGPYETVYLTPGMQKHRPEIEAFREAGARITCETDLFLARCPAPVIGITGSAGKTTTTTLVGEILKRAGTRPVYVGGNIGVPLLPEIDRITPESWVVMELSSFQLELVERSPHGAAVLNLSENHLDVHGSMAAYAEAKSRIFRFQGTEDWLVLPDPPIAWFEPWVTHHRGRRLSFSDRGPVTRGAYLADDVLWWQPGGEARPVLPRAEWPLPGAMNLRNALAALAISLAAGAPVEAAREALRTFRGVPHRLEVVAEQDGIRYINDSIATAPDRTLAALEALAGPLVIILGGYDKHLDYTELGRAVSRRARVVVLVGAVREKIRAALLPGPEVVVAETFDEAVRAACRAARPGDTVLLSPAAASYDMFRNFEERGERFRALVREEIQ
jgi:UDP-N-acetylmuramoylalanine--D-glutamate ligase